MDDGERGVGKVGGGAGREGGGVDVCDAVE